MKKTIKILTVLRHDREKKACAELKISIIMAIIIIIMVINETKLHN